MNQITKKQHYIWRNYLAPWTNNHTNTGQIICFRNNRIFATSLMNVAHENYFYGVKELSKQEKDIIFEIAIKNTKGMQRTTNEGWLNLYCAPYDLADQMTSLGYPVLGHMDRTELENNQTFINWRIEFIEELHSQIESTGIQYISLLRQSDLSFWRSEADRDRFSFFLSNQYFRTKNIRDRIIYVIEKVKVENHFFLDVHPENIWLPLSLIFASNVGVHIAQDFSAVLLQSDEDDFIVGDQPVLNTYSTFDMLTPPKEMQLFYPISPSCALLLTRNMEYSNGQTLKITAAEVQKYNVLEHRASKELLFAKERSSLEAFLSSEKR